MSRPHSSICACTNCNSGRLTQKEKELHLEISSNSRREFLRTAGMLGLGMGVGGGLVTPMAAAASNTPESNLEEAGIYANKAVKNGKASVITLLHTADIHSQLSIHDEFFIENEKVVYKKRGGFATLKTMINKLRAKNPSGTLVIDGGDC